MLARVASRPAALETLSAEPCPTPQLSVTFNPDQPRNARGVSPSTPGNYTRGLLGTSTGTCQDHDSSATGNSLNFSSCSHSSPNAAHLVHGGDTERIALRGWERRLFAALDAELPALPDSPKLKLPGPPVKDPPVPSALVNVARHAQPRSSQLLGPVMQAAGPRQKLAWGELAEVPWGKVCYVANKNDRTHSAQADLVRAELFTPSSKLWSPDRCQNSDWRQNGGELRMAFIEETLFAPPCPECAEVSTLVEAALTSRRLRHYDVAIALLLRARALWGRVLADGQQAGNSEPPLDTAPPRRHAWSSPATRADCNAWPFCADECEPLLRRRLMPTGSTSNVVDALGVQRASPTNAADHDAARPGGWRYDTVTDFHDACGDDDPNLSCLVPEVSLFFLCELASLHGTIGEDIMAAQLLLRALVPTKALPATHPDSSLVWCCLSRALSRCREHNLAARAALLSLRIRGRTLGRFAVETGVAHNNLACCLLNLRRPQAALAHAESAVEIMRVSAGDDHPRSQTAQRNLEKVRQASRGQGPCKIPLLFAIPVKDQVKMPRATGKNSKRRPKSTR